MNEHFKGKFEAELKFNLTDPLDFVRQLTHAGAEIFVLNNQEKDDYYENATAALSSQGISMNLRVMQPSGIKLWIVKGPLPSQCEAINIDDPYKVASMLNKLGYRLHLQIEKRRSIYFYLQFHITVDHVEKLGHFAEIAIMTDDQSQLAYFTEQLQDVAGKFGLHKKDIEPRSYRQMMLEIAD